jgi:mannose-6-phosphate isomerase
MLKTVNKPWGFEKHLYKKDDAKIKLICIKKEHSLSLQYHKEKEETMYLIEGKALMILDEDFFIMKSKTPYYIAPEMKHRVTAITDTTIAEVSFGSDKDIIRIEDNYGRVK